MVSTSYKRKNGFSWPPDKAQIIAWFLIIYFGLIFIGSFTLSLNKPFSFAITSIFVILYILTFTLIVIVSAINPGEEATLKRRISPQNNFDRTKHKHVIENQFCNICQIAVSIKAKHCRRCNKCVTHFDHHCIYFNNCIGARNYRLFIVTISVIFIGLFYIFLIGLIEFAISFKQDQSFLTKEYYSISNSSLCNEFYCNDEYKYYPVFGPVSLNAWRSVVMVTTVLSFVCLSLIGYLISYHIFLHINKMTTYDHTVKLKLKYDEKQLKSAQSNLNKFDEYKKPPSSMYSANVRSKSLDKKNIETTTKVLSSQKLPKLDLQQSQQTNFSIKENKESKNVFKSFNKSNSKRIDDSTSDSTNSKKSMPSLSASSPINEITNSLSCIQKESDEYNYFTMLNEKSRPNSVTNNRSDIKSSPIFERKQPINDKPLFILTNPNGSNTFINLEESLNKSRSKSVNSSTNIVKLPIHSGYDSKKNFYDSSQTETDSDPDILRIDINNINKYLKKKRESNQKVEPFRKNSISILKNEKLKHDLNRSNSEVANVNIKYNKHNNDQYIIRNNINNDYKRNESYY